MISQDEEAMNQRNIGIYLIAKELGVDFNRFEGKENFDQRLIFQKLMFLAFQSSEFKNLGCQYGLYIHGPYSPELAGIGYESAKTIPSLGSYSFNETGKKKFNDFKSKLPPQIKKIIDKLIKEKALSPEEIKVLEIFSTLVMQCTNYYFMDSDIEKYKDNIKMDFKRFKPNLSVDDNLLTTLFYEAVKFIKDNDVN